MKCVLALAAVVLTIFLCISGAHSQRSLSQSASLELSNVATPKIPNKTWEWTAFVKGTPDVIDQISCVEYTLHPTFPNPVQKVCETRDPLYPFGLKAEGWGTFNIRAKVEFKDGTSKDLVHMLDFTDPKAPQK